MTGSTQYIDLLDAIHVYFQGEITEALIFILPIGVLSMVFSIWLFTDNPGSFAKGVAIPFLLLGLLMGTVGSVVGFRTPSQMTDVMKTMEVDLQAGVQAETQRMIKVNKAWPIYLAIWGLFGIAGLLLRFAERRTHPYVDALNVNALIPEAPR